MIGAVGGVVRAVRFRLWSAGARVRLARHGCRFRLECAGTPRFYGLPRIETEAVGAATGSLTLRIGRDVKLGRDLTLDLWTGTDGVIEIGDRVTFQNRVRLQPWGGAIRLADDVQVRDACELKSKGELRLGHRAILGRNVTLHCDTAITLGDRVGLAERVTVADSDHANDGSDTFFMDQPVIADPVVLEHNVFAGTNAVILRGARIGANAVVAAGALVTKGEYPPRFLLVGAPAKPLKEIGGR